MNSTRSTGLDALRATAIALVFMYHYMVFVSREPTFGWASVVGWVGVDLFFVLSGYLIGNQVFAGWVRGERLSLRAFYARRALRTWPAFWVVLAAYFLFPAQMGGREPPPLWMFLTFTQNYQLQPGTAFSHAWSLCIEEQFYLVLPCVVLAGMKLGRIGGQRRHAWLLLLALMAVGVTARAVLWTQHGRDDMGGTAGYHPNIYYATLCRFDELLPGVAVALLKNLHPQVWSRLQRHGTALWVVAVVAVAAVLYGVHSHYYIEDYGYGFFMTAFGYSLVAVAFALLVAAALVKGSVLERVRIPGAHHVALWSYSIYLSHKAVGFIVAEQAARWAWSPTLRLVLVCSGSLLAGAVLYQVVEQPFMRLRDRWFPSLFARPVAGLPSHLTRNGHERF